MFKGSNVWVFCMEMCMSMWVILGLIMVVGNSACESDKVLDQQRLVVDLSEESSLVKVNNALIPIPVNLIKEGPTLLISELLDLDNLKILPLQTTPHCLIGGVDKVIFTPEYILVLDKSVARQVLCYDLEGNFVRKISQHGKGPGEYDDPLDIEVSGQIIYILDRQSRLFSYTMTGDFMQSKLLPFQTSHMAAIQDDAMFFNSHELNFPWTGILRQLDHQDRLVSQDFPIPNEQYGQIGISQAFSKSSNALLFVKLGTDTLYEIHSDRVIPKYQLQFKDLYPTHASDGAAIHPFLQRTGLYHKGFVELDEHLIFSLSQPPKIFHAFYHLSTHRLRLFDRVKDDVFLGSLRSVFPVGTRLNKLIFILDPYLLVHQYHALKKEFSHDQAQWEEIERYLQERIPGIAGWRADQNPILMFALIHPKFYDRPQ